MAFELSISKVTSTIKKAEERNVLKLILNEMQHRQENGIELHDYYGSYLPHLMPFSNDVIRHMSKALLFLWEFCYDEGIPLLNFLLKNKEYDEPGNGVLEWYAETFQTMNHYFDYCNLQAELAKMSLLTGIVKIVP